jgi:hypothetical protein
MRTVFATVLLVLLSASLLAQQRPSAPPGLTRTTDKCCPAVYDATGKKIGDMIRWDDRFQSIQLWAWVRYPMRGGDVALLVSPEGFQGMQGPGGSVALFTTPDCSGNQMFAMLAWPPLMKRYAMVLPAGNPSSLLIDATNGWLWVTDPLPARVHPGSTVFRSQWGDQGSCVPYPPPGYTVAPSPMGGYWMHKVEDLYAKFKRPYYSE